MVQVAHPCCAVRQQPMALAAPPKSCPCLMQARYVARVLSGRVQLPTRSQMHAQVQDFYDLLQLARVPVRYTHSQVGGRLLLYDRAKVQSHSKLGAGCSYVAGGLSPPNNVLLCWRHSVRGPRMCLTCD